MWILFLNLIKTQILLLSTFFTEWCICLLLSVCIVSKVHSTVLPVAAIYLFALTISRWQRYHQYKQIIVWLSCVAWYPSHPTVCPKLQICNKHSLQPQASPCSPFRSSQSTVGFWNRYFTNWQVGHLKMEFWGRQKMGHCDRVLEIKSSSVERKIPIGKKMESFFSHHCTNVLHKWQSDPQGENSSSFSWTSLHLRAGSFK